MKALVSFIYVPNKMTAFRKIETHEMLSHEFQVSLFEIFKLHWHFIFVYSIAQNTTIVFSFKSSFLKKF